mmetsp:Transcript_1802/g.4313  ORF Transcript_1802/g.4313 Transcript_1802/m.4313 type:complete len:207 (-) Transcript_1802:301-921(-)
MVCDERMPGIDLLKFRQQASRNVSRPLQCSQQELYALLPFLEVGPSRSRTQHVGWAKSFIVFDEFDYVHGFHHDQVLVIFVIRGKTHNRGDFLSNESRRGMNIVVRHKHELVLHILESKSKSHSDTKRAVIVVVDSWDERWILWAEAFGFHKLLDRCCRGCHGFAGAGRFRRGRVRVHCNIARETQGSRRGPVDNQSIATVKGKQE